MIATILIIVICAIILIIFSFPQFSPIPYFPSNKKDLDLIIQAIKLKNNQTVIDLGAGDGIVLFEAAKTANIKKLNTQFIAVDINPLLLFVMYIRKLFHPNKRNITIRYGNMFHMKFFESCKLITKHSNHISFYLYISPWYLEKTIKNIYSQFEHCKIISYMYPILSLKNKQKEIKGNIHDIFEYTV